MIYCDRSGKVHGKRNFKLGKSQGILSLLVGRERSFKEVKERNLLIVISFLLSQPFQNGKCVVMFLV